MNSSDHTFIIAEIGQAHDGSLGLLHAYIDAVATTGADAVKFQTHIAEAESSIDEPFRVHFSKQDSTRYDYWQRMSFTQAQWAEIRNHCEQSGLEFMSTPFSIAAVELLEKLGVKRYKVGSGDINNYLLLDRIAYTGKPLIISTGMSSYQEIGATLEHLKPYRDQITLMQCTTQYPTPLENVGLNNLSEYSKRFKVDVGLSDHSGTIYPSAIAAVKGATIIENHVVFDKRMFGPDTTSSLTIEEMTSLVKFIRAHETINKNPVEKQEEHVQPDLKAMFGRSLSVRESLPKYHKLTINDLESKKPAGKGIECNKYLNVIGKKLNKSLSKYDFLKEEDIE